MAEASVGGQSGENSVQLGGYRQELKRTLGSFQVFAISFAFISVAVGIFATYDDVLQNAGPIGIWLWVIAAVGQALVALIVAQFAARIPLSGSSYQWASRLANPKIGWGFGWLTFCYLAIAVVAVDNALASQAFMPLIGLEPDEGTARLITLVVLLIQVLIAVGSTRIVSLINASAVGLELVLVVVVAIMLFVAVAITGDGAVGNLTSRGVAENASDYFAIGGGLMLAMLIGLATLVGFDAACSRIVFAMSRDSRFPAHRLMRRVDPRTHTPVPATILIFVIGVVLMVVLPGAALLELITAATILPAIIYGLTVILYLGVRRRLDRRKGAFDLGRFELPVAFGALTWSVVALFMLAVPAGRWSPS
ncbi:APC family permease [Streptosporangium lutulentum]